jgi:hypothetical protein
MPCLQNVFQVVDNDSPDTVQFVSCNVMIRTHHDKGQPKLAHHALAAHVDVEGYGQSKLKKKKRNGPGSSGSAGIPSTLGSSRGK